MKDELKAQEAGTKHQPIDIYLDHCKEYTEKNITTVIKEQYPYKWMPSDFEGDMIHPRIADYIKEKHPYNEASGRAGDEVHDHSSED